MLNDRDYRPTLTKRFAMQQEIALIGYLRSAVGIETRPKRVETTRRVEVYELTLNRMLSGSDNFTGIGDQESHII